MKSIAILSATLDELGIWLAWSYQGIKKCSFSGWGQFSKAFAGAQVHLSYHDQQVESTLFDQETTRLEPYLSQQELDDRRVYIVKKRIQHSQFVTLIMEIYAQEIENQSQN